MGFSRKELTLEIHPHIVWVPATPIKKMAKKDKESPNYEKKAGKPFNHSKMGPIFTSFTPQFRNFAPPILQFCPPNFVILPPENANLLKNTPKTL